MGLVRSGYRATRSPMNRRGRGAGLAASWNGMLRCARPCWGTCDSAWSPDAGDQDTWRGDFDVGRSSPTRPSIVSANRRFKSYDGQVARTKDYSWRALPAARQDETATPSASVGRSRGLLHCQAPSTGGTSPDIGGQDKPNPGHWEADLMLSGRGGHAVLALHERHSRLLIAARQPGKAADPSRQHHVRSCSRS